MQVLTTAPRPSSQVGVLASPFKEDSGLTIAETRAHFGAWAIVSSPLTLSHDPNNQTIMDAIWPIMSNKEVLAVNQVTPLSEHTQLLLSPDEL